MRNNLTHDLHAEVDERAMRGFIQAVAYTERNEHMEIKFLAALSYLVGRMHGILKRLQRRASRGTRGSRRTV